MKRAEGEEHLEKSIFTPGALTLCFALPRCEELLIADVSLSAFACLCLFSYLASPSFIFTLCLPFVISAHLATLGFHAFSRGLPSIRPNHCARISISTVMRG